jgi:hypothetical protein
MIGKNDKTMTKENLMTSMQKRHSKSPQSIEASGDKKLLCDRLRSQRSPTTLISTGDKR